MFGRFGTAFFGMTEFLGRITRFFGEIISLKSELVTEVSLKSNILTEVPLKSNILTEVPLKSYIFNKE